MRQTFEYRLWTRYPGESIWERYSGGVKPEREIWEGVARRDHARRMRNGQKPLEYSITEREVIDYPREILDIGASL